MASTSGGGGVVHSERVRNTRVIKSIVYGNHASLLPHKNDKGHTHHWKVYVRAYDTQENLSHYIRKVQFRLHESYQNSVRMVEKVPFELNETGWGEFDIQVSKLFLPKMSALPSDTLNRRSQYNDKLNYLCLINIQNSIWK